MIIEMYKVGGHFARADSEKAVKVVASDEEVDEFVRGVMLSADDGCDPDFLDHVTNGWRPYKPYTEDEKAAYPDGDARFLILFERHFPALTAMWFRMATAAI